jgi:gliding motility-associated-like protein
MTSIQRQILLSLSALTISAYIHAQINCPNGLVYIAPNYFSSSSYIQVYDPSLPYSASNPSNTNIQCNQCGGLALLPNLNGGTLSPTFYSVFSGKYHYWNGTTWVNTGHSASGPNLAGCPGMIFNITAPPPIKIYKYAGTGPDNLILTLPGNYSADLVTDCNCNFYFMSYNTMYKYSSNAQLITTYSLTGSYPSTPAGMAIVGNTVYVIGSGLFCVGIISGSIINFTLINNIGNLNDMASCPAKVTETVFASINTGTIGCIPVPVTLSVSSTATSLNYSWSGPGIGNSIPGGSVISVNSAGLYTCVITQNSCDYALSTLVSTVASNTTAVTPSILPGNKLCFSPFMQLNSSYSSSNYSYQWTGTAISGSVSSPAVYLHGPGIYTLLVTEKSNGCSGIISATVLPSPILDFTVSTPTLCVISAVGKDKAILSYSGAANYTLQVANGFSAQLIPSQAVLLFQLPPFAHLGAPGSATIWGTNGACTSSAQVNFSVLPLTEITVVPQNTIVCKNATLELTAHGGIKYSWMTSNKISGTDSLISVQPGVDFVYTVNALDRNGCDTPPLTFSVSLFPPHYGALLSTGFFCAPACPQFSFDAGSERNNRIYADWTVEGVRFINTNFIRPCFGLPGEYEIKGMLTDSLNHCSNEVAYNVKILPRPKADFEMSPLKPVELLDEIFFENRSIGGNQSEWNWYIEGEGVADRKKPSFSLTFPASGVYPVALVVKNSWGCADTVIKALQVMEDFLFYIPNTFTPNDDGLNDLFFPVMRGVRSLQLSVYNRWGQRIYHTASLSDSWNGFYGGEPCSDGTYAWKAGVITKNGTSKSYAGHVVLNR